MVNLLSNVIKYSPNSDKVDLRMKVKEQRVIIEVQDYGVGIELNKQSKLFERFYRVEETAHRFSGLGIGLYISYEIIKRHGGDIWVNSQKDVGSTFYISLPISE